MNKKISIILIISVIILLAVFVAGIFLYLSKGDIFNNNSKTKKSKLIFCTEEAKICPDGSAVGRSGPSCEFAPCPEIVGISDKIILTSLKPNEEISNPVEILGKARGTWFFEGSFPIEIYDDNNKLLISTTAIFVPKSEEDTWMTEDFVDFKSIINFNEPSVDSGYIIFKKDNPSDMRELDEEFKLPVIFNKNIDYNVDTSNWQTYRNDEYGFEFKYPNEIQLQKQADGLIIAYGKDALGYDRTIRIYNNNSKKDLEVWFDSKFEKKPNEDCNKIESPYVKVENAYTILISGDSLEYSCLNGGTYTISPNKAIVIEWASGYGPDKSGSDRIPSTFKFTD